jgi:hypothetical protein
LNGWSNDDDLLPARPYLHLLCVAQPIRHAVRQRSVLPQHQRLRLIVSAHLLLKPRAVRPNRGAVLPDRRRIARWRLLYSHKRVWAQLLPAGSAVSERQHVLQLAGHLWRQCVLPGWADMSGECCLLQCGSGAKWRLKLGDRFSSYSFSVYGSLPGICASMCDWGSNAVGMFAACCGEQPAAAYAS